MPVPVVAGEVAVPVVAVPVAVAVPVVAGAADTRREEQRKITSVRYYVTEGMMWEKLRTCTTEGLLQGLCLSNFISCTCCRQTFCCCLLECGALARAWCVGAREERTRNVCGNIWLYYIDEQIWYGVYGIGNKTHKLHPAVAPAWVTHPMIQALVGSVSAEVAVVSWANATEATEARTTVATVNFIVECRRILFFSWQKDDEMGREGKRKGRWWKWFDFEKERKKK